MYVTQTVQSTPPSSPLAASDSKRVESERGRMPALSSLPPWMVKVLPELVGPYAKMSPATKPR